MEIIVEVKNVYGKPLVYPVSEEAKLFAIIAESKTLTPRVLKIIDSLGYEIWEDKGFHNYGSLEFNRILNGEAV
tara:strand:+ start:321 stop:542 length:222 start_codon:yes stop_codon:yes gene_type:complete